VLNKYRMQAVLEIYAEENRVVGVTTIDGPLYLVSPRIVTDQEVEDKVKEIERREDRY
jgi:hypothetical protein